MTGLMIDDLGYLKWYFSIVDRNWYLMCSKVIFVYPDLYNLVT